VEAVILYACLQVPLEITRIVIRPGVGKSGGCENNEAEWRNC